jgi:hypothetical protein
MSESYLGQVLEGRALWTDIDDWIDRWHEEGGAEQLHDYLGLSWDEYRLWAEQPSSLRFIIAAHERDEPVEQLLEHHEHALAARGLSEEDARTVRQWLQKTGRL